MQQRVVPKVHERVLYVDEDNQAAIAMVIDEKPTARGCRVAIQWFEIQEWGWLDRVNVSAVCDQHCRRCYQ